MTSRVRQTHLTYNTRGKSYVKITQTIALLLLILPTVKADHVITQPKVFPSVIAINTPTTLTVRVIVAPDPDVIAGSVNLIRLNKYGRPMSVLARLYDDGSHGDQVAGDSIYTGQASLTATVIGPVLLAVTAAYSSSPVRATSVVFSVDAGKGPLYPLKRSPGRRYLLTQSGIPFLLTGDAPHSMFVNLSVADADMFMFNRASHGVNALWVEVLCNGYTAGRSDGSTYDGIAPFTDPTDISTPNDAYFARIDTMVGIAAKYNITIFLDAFETGGWMSFLEAQGNAKAFNWGVFLGNRFRDVPNVVWITGNDFQTWSLSPTDNELIKNIMAGISSADSNHLQTIELNFDVSGSLDDGITAPFVSLAGAYTYYPTYDEVLTQYNKDPFQPVYLQEGHYDGEWVGGCCGESGTPNILRRQAYWSVLAGAVAGQMYGSRIWPFYSGWQYEMDTTGIAQLGVWKAFLTSRRWYELIPDQGHTIVTSGYGTYYGSGALGTNDYVTTASTPDGHLVLAYTPVSHSLRVDMTKMSGNTAARWFDPTNGAYVIVDGSPFPNSGMMVFNSPGNNSAGDSDWVLVLESR
jgi:hypothetical protein